MDETDLAICRALLENSRTPFTELGRSLGLTAQAVHRRVQDLTSEGILAGTVTRLTASALGRMWVLTHGWSRGGSIDTVVARLGEDPSVIFVQYASGNYVYVHGMVGDAAHMAGYVSGVQRIASVQELQMGIVRTPPPAGPGSLTPVDLRLVSSLRDDTRKPLSQVAEEAGVTPKTARRRLDRLVGEGLIQFTIQWMPLKIGDIITNLHLTVREGMVPERVALQLIKDMSANVVRTFAFSNLPNQLLVTFWTRNIIDMQRICQEVEASGMYSTVLPNILRGGRYFEEHQARELERMLRAGGAGGRARRLDG